jgi:hypothetical protein
MRRLAVICCVGASLLLQACGRASETQFQSALEEAGRLMTYSRDREAAGLREIDRAKPADACPDFRAAAIRADGAVNVMRQAGHPDAAWAEAQGWGRQLAAATAQRDAMLMRARQTCG